MKVYVKIVDTLTGIFQSGVIEESVIKNQEIPNAVKHFGIIYGEVEWDKSTKLNIANSPEILIGHVTGANKIVSVIKVVSDQPSD